MADARITIPDDASWKQRCKEKLEKLEEENFTLSEDEEKLRKFQEKYAMENISMDFKIYEAIKDGDPDKFTDALKDVCKMEKLRLFVILDQFAHGGDSMLHVAAKYGSEKIAELVARHHPYLLKAKNIKGNTALHEAARSKEGGSNVIKVILSQHDAWQRKTVEDITRSKNCVGNTALHEAVACGYLDGVTELYHKDKAVTHQLNNVNKSPLYMAVYNYMRGNNIVKPSQREQKNSNAKEIIDCLLQDSLLENMPNPSWREGQSPLHAAIKAISVLYEELVNKRPEMIYLKDEDGRTPLHYAALCGYLHGVRIMLKKNLAAALECDVYGDLPIHLACKYGRIDVVKELLQIECPYDEGLLNGRSENILHAAAMSGKHDVVKYILKKENNVKINLNETDVHGNTPLHLASKNMHPMVLFHLTRDERVDLQCQNMDGLMARDIFLKHCQKPMTYGEVVSYAILSSSNAYCSEEGLQPSYDRKRMEESVNTLMLVAVLIATVTFAAGFTVPGSVHGPDNNDPKLQLEGTAVLVKRTVFQIFMICNTIAMYSSTLVVFLILLWARHGDYALASATNSFDIALHMMALALMTMSGAFMAAAYLIVHNVSWLVYLIIATGIISILFIFGAYILVIFPFERQHPLLRPASDILFKILIPFIGIRKSPGLEDSKKDKKSSGLEDSSKDKNI